MAMLAAAHVISDRPTVTGRSDRACDTLQVRSALLLAQRIQIFVNTETAWLRGQEVRWAGVIAAHSWRQGSSCGAPFTGRSARECDALQVRSALLLRSAHLDAAEAAVVHYWSSALGTSLECSVFVRAPGLSRADAR